VGYGGVRQIRYGLLRLGTIGCVLVSWVLVRQIWLGGVRRVSGGELRFVKIWQGS